MKKIERTINYYQLQFHFNKNFQPISDNKYADIFTMLIQLAKSRAKIRYQQFGEKAIFIHGINLDQSNKLIMGKLRCVRKDLLPEIMDTNTDITRGIDAKDEEGLLETTHFIIDYSQINNPILSLEFNQFGAKIGDFVLYLKNIGQSKNALIDVGYAPIVRDELSKLKERINRFSEFKVKVHKDNIEKIRNMDNKLYSALKASIEHFNSDNATLILKFDYKQREENKPMNNSISNIINKLINNKENTGLFNILSIKAEDSENNNLLETFDLLIDKVKSRVKVEKRKRYRTIISQDMFEKMRVELRKIKIR